MSFTNFREFDVLIKKLLREPLLHFLILGAGLFVLFYQVADPSSERSDRIIVTQSDIDRLTTQWQRQWKRPPTQKELSGMIESYVRETILYREALALGLDQNDIIIRRRLGQKLEFMFKDLAEQIDPSEEELITFMQKHRDRYTDPERYSLTHVYFSRDARGPETEIDARNELVKLHQQKNTVDVNEVGDRFLYQYQFDNQTPAQLSRVFGNAFVESLAAVEVGRWVGPIESGYGLHLVYIDQRTEPRQLQLDETREKVRWDVLAARRQEIDQAFYNELRKKYEVVMENSESALAKFGPGAEQ